MHDDYVSTEHFLLALAGQNGAGAQRMLGRLGVTRDRILSALTAIRGNQRVTSPESGSDLPGPGQVRPRPDTGGTRGEA